MKPHIPTLPLLGKTTLVLLGSLLFTATAMAQEAPPATDISVNSPFHNQLFFNRFLINPTFSVVRENKSYLNILHRNQYASYEDNAQNYYLGFSNMLNDNTALGIGVYGQWEGVIQEFGFNANYATAVRLGEKSKLTFGTNVTYLSEGLDQNRISAQAQDPSLQDTRKENKIAIQPGIALSLGAFDFGVYATELFNYNQTTNTFITNLNDKSIKAALQYTHSFNTSTGLFADGRLMPLVQVGKNEEGELAYIGSMLLDLPNYGWFQTTLNDDFGLSLGLGFNLSQKLSLGYLMEKDLSDEGANLGLNHEVSLAYTFKEELFDTAMDDSNMSHDAHVDQIVRNYEEQIKQLMDERGSGEVTANSMAYENRMILDELILRQDSVERARDEMFERRFETLVRVLRNEIKRSQDEDFNKGLPGHAGTTMVAENAGQNTVSKKQTNAPIADGQVAANGKKDYRADFKELPLRQTENRVAVTETQPVKNIKKDYRADFKELPIRVKNRSDIVGVDSGYYLIANVYKNKKYLKAFVDDLKEQGFDARQFYNKENGLYYVYLADFKSKADAKTAITSNLNGKYQQEKWVMQVYNPMATAEVTFDN